MTGEWYACLICQFIRERGVRILRHYSGREESRDLPYMPTRNLIETERTRVIDMAKELLAVG